MHGNTGATAIVCWNDLGVFLESSSITLVGISNAMTLEALACREALALANDLLARRILVPSDCLSVI